MKRARSPSADACDDRRDAQHAVTLLLREFPCMQMHLPLLRSRTREQIEALAETLRTVTRHLQGPSPGVGGGAS